MVRRGDRRGTLFLLLWLGLEALAYYPLTPFPAARRVLGPLVVLTLLVGRLAARTARRRGPAARRRALTACGAALGLAYFALDFREAWAEEWGAERAAAWIGAQGGDGRVWYIGHYGFQYYAESLRDATGVSRHGPRPMRRARATGWCGRTGASVIRNWTSTDPALEEVQRLTLDDPVPLRTVACYYGGRAPLEHHEGPRMTVRIYRVVADFQPKPAKKLKKTAQPLHQPLLGFPVYQTRRPLDADLARRQYGSASALRSMP